MEIKVFYPSDDSLKKESLEIYVIKLEEQIEKEFEELKTINYVAPKILDFMKHYNYGLLLRCIDREHTKNKETYYIEIAERIKNNDIFKGHQLFESYFKEETVPLWI